MIVVRLPLKFRMAKADLHPPPVTPDQVVAAIARLYQQLQAVPCAHDHNRARTPAYLTLEAQIRTLARQHWALTTPGEGSRR